MAAKALQATGIWLRPAPNPPRSGMANLCRRPDLNRHAPDGTRDFKSLASTIPPLRQSASGQQVAAAGLGGQVPEVPGVSHFVEWQGSGIEAVRHTRRGSTCRSQIGHTSSRIQGLANQSEVVPLPHCLIRRLLAACPRETPGIGDQAGPSRAYSGWLKPSMI